MGRLPPAVRLLGIGWYIAFCIIMGTVGGVLLDRWLDLRPLLTLVGLFLGLLAAFWGGYVLLLEALGTGKPEGRKDG